MSTAAASLVSIATERRGHLRLNVRWPIRLSPGEQGAPVDAHTANISSTGFCCHCSESFTPGAMLTCDIRIPSWTPGDPDAALILHCRARVVWVKWDKVTAQFDIGCHIESYSALLGR